MRISGLALKMLGWAVGRRRRGNRTGGEMRHEEKKDGVRRYMKVEIHETVYQKATTANKAGEVQRGSKGLVALQQLTQRNEVKNAEEGTTAEAASDAGFCQTLEVVVVRVIDNFSIVVGFVGGENGL